MVEGEKPKMIYKYLGKTGIRVSALGFGNWLHNNTEDMECQSIMKRAFEAGVNYFDIAEAYGFLDQKWGRAETVMGNCIKNLGWNRKDYVISTKLWENGVGVNDRSLSRKHIIEGMRGSLNRLQLTYVDIVFAHRYDEGVPIEEVVRAFDWLIRKGKAFYWGTSMWTPAQIMEANECCEKLGLMKPVVEQSEYSMLKRDNMENMLPFIFEKCAIGTTIYSPLGMGVLTGRYNDGKLPEEGRYVSKFTGERRERIYGSFMGKTEEEVSKTCQKLTALGEIAKDLGCSQANLALAWCMVNSDVTVALMGASKLAQMEDNIKSIEVATKWTPELELKISVLYIYIYIIGNS